MAVPSGSLPAERVFAPLPESTRIGWAPTAVAAWRSRRLSPTQGARSSATLRRSAMAKNIPGLGQAGDRLEAPGDRPPLVGMLDKLVAVVVDHAVAVEDDEFHIASLEISENRFIAFRTSVSRASLFSRSFLSSVMTMTASKNESTGLFKDAKAFRYPAKSPESNRGFAERDAVCNASKSEISAGSLRAETSAPENDSPLLSACRSMLAIRLFAAARLAASGSAENVRTASSCLGMRAIATGFRLRTASTSFAE